MSFINKEKNFTIILILISILFALTHSIHWITPLYYFGEDYIPIFFGNTIFDRGGDDYFYFTFLNDIINGKIFYSDPVNKEFVGIYSLYNTYNFSLLFSSIAGFFSDNIKITYFFIYLFFPFLNFLLMGFFLKLFFKSNLLIFFITSVTLFLGFSPQFVFLILDIFQYYLSLGEVNFNSLDLIKKSNQLYRFPTILVTNLHLIISIIIIYYYFNERNVSSRFYALAIISTSIFFSLNNFILISVFFLLLFLKDFKINKNTFVDSILFSLAFLPALIFLIEALANIDLIKGLIIEKENLNSIENISKDKKFNLKFNFVYLIYFSILFFVNLTLNYKYKNLISYFLIANLLVYLIFSIFLGNEYTYRIYNRGSEIVISLFALVIFFKILEKFNFEVLRKLKNYSKLILIPLFFTIIFHAINFEIQMSKNKYKPNQNFIKLNNWIENNFVDDEIFISLDPVVNLNLPIYNNINTYLSHTISSRSNFDQRSERLIDVFKFYGFKNEIFLDYVFSNFDKNNLDSLLINSFLISYNSELNEKLLKSSDFKELLEKKFKNTKIKTNLKANYLILSNFDKKFINEFSNIKKYLVSNLLLYSNEEYSIFKFN